LRWKKRTVSKKYSITEPTDINTPTEKSEAEEEAPKPKKQRIKKMANRRVCFL